MKMHVFERALSLILAAVLVLGLCPPVSAAPEGLRWELTDTDVVWDRSDRLVRETDRELTTHKPTDLVRVSIVLEGTPTLRAGYETMGIGSNTAALKYDRDLMRIQRNMERTISLQALGGRRLDVVWNLTLASNIISANVPWGSVEAIRSVKGVRDVVVEQQYTAESVQIDQYISAETVGAAAVWETGLTGAGTRVAIIDTGTDTDHQSFDSGAFLHALAQNAADRDMEIGGYIDSLELLDPEGIDAVLKHLNAAERIGADASDYYLSEKLPFAANYVDCDLTVDHDSDSQGSHGSHVAGIAAANRFIPGPEGYVGARESVRMCGVAPDAQIITLKVFGNAEGPFDSDYFAAIEDAIWLGCDSVNLSLGSGAPGTSSNPMFAELLDFLASTDTVVVMSSGNSGFWAEHSVPGYLYSDGVSFHTAGSPGTYTNSLAVASVDNDGAVGSYIRVGGSMIVYSETDGYTNRPMTSLDTTGRGTDYEYVFIDGIGEASDYTGIDLTGKVVFCSRGETSFSEKANVAAGLGASAVIIFNDQSGVLSMDLRDYRFSAPCAAITRADANEIRAASEVHTAADGITYRTGTLTVEGGLGAGSYHSEFYSMSDFSSWGVPGSLELKPEITAPGGAIWSVNGMDPTGTGYESMSGTSMAAPQVTGMAALTAEYIREQELAQLEGTSIRHLAQSLLMSTAVPLREEASGGGYYSILNQGAGLARVDLAVNSGSWIEVGGMPDGKVKVELGDDPNRSGVYSFDFTIHNLTDEDQSYNLSAEVFTQGILEEGGVSLLDTRTRPLDAEADFCAERVTLAVAKRAFSCDLNGDGVTDAEDADHLLEYLVGNETHLHVDGDVSGDGLVNSYDAHVLLSMLRDGYRAEVPAGGSVTIAAELRLTADTKALLNAQYPAGAYIEAFVFAEPVSNAGEEQGVTHSIPVLGYYGSWTEPGMFDVGSWLEYEGGTQTRKPYLWNVNGNHSNYVSVSYGDGAEYLFGGNPYVQEEQYLPQRNALCNQDGALLNSIRFTLIRNASAVRLQVRSTRTGEVYAERVYGELPGAYFHTNTGAWQNVQYRKNLGLDLSRIPEGTEVELCLEAAPELFCTYDPISGAYEADYAALADGARLVIPFTIDNTAPELCSVELVKGDTLQITARDNRYIAAVALMNASGTSILTAAAANQLQPDTELTCSLELDGVFGEEFLAAVYDYAGNVTVGRIVLELDTERPYFTAVDRSSANAQQPAAYVGLEADGSWVRLAPADGRETTRAAAYVEGYVFEITDDSRLYVAPDADLHSFRDLGELDPSGQWQIAGFNDLAYNPADGQLYGTFYSHKNEQELPYLCTIGLYDASMTVLGEMPIDANTLAIDGAGNFYSIPFGSEKLYTYTADVIRTGRTALIGKVGEYATTNINSLAWDHNRDTLYWACTRGQNTTQLLRLDPATAQAELVSRYDFTAVGLYIAHEIREDLFAPADWVQAVELPEETSVLVRSSTRLSARVWPWNVSDSTVIWSSDAPDVAAVDTQGNVTGIRAGTARIRAVSRLDPSKSAECTVTVNALDGALNALVWDEDGQVWWSRFRCDSLPDYERLRAVEPNLPVNATMIADGTLYASTLNTGTMTSDLYIVDPETFEMTRAGGSASIAYADMAYSPSLGRGLAVCFGYVVLVDLETGEHVGAWDWNGGMSADLVGITYYGTDYNSTYGTNMDYFLLLDADGKVYLDAWIDPGNGPAHFQDPQSGLIRSIGEAVDTAYFQGFYFDGSYTYWARFHEADDSVELIVWDCEGADSVYSVGRFPERVWPVGGLYAGGELNGSMALADGHLTTAAVREQELLHQITIPDRGGLHAAYSIASAEDASVTLKLTAGAQTPNGVLTVQYDPLILEPLTAAGMTEAFAWSHTGDGTLVLAFAARTALSASDAAAVLRFRPRKEGQTDITIRKEELADQSAAVEETVTLTLPHICPSERFQDVNEAHWFHEAVDHVISTGAMNGMDAVHFGPELNMERCQFVTVLYRMEQCPAVEHTGVFRDIREGEFYTDAVYWALENGITTGTAEDTFDPFGKVTRSELVTFLYRYAAYKGYDVTAAAEMSRYRDAEQIPAFSAVAWSWCVAEGIITGMTPDTLGPSGLATRAQAAVIFQRFDSSFSA